MLPEALSNEACSLVPGQDRLAVTVEMELRGRARSCATAFHRSLIRSDERLDYPQVDRDLRRARERGREPWAEPLAAAREVAAALEAGARARAARWRSSRVEPEFAFDARGPRDGARAERADRVAPR